MNNEEIKIFINNSLKEDIGDGDHTSMACIEKHTNHKAKLIAKENGIIAGVSLAKMIFSHVDNNLNIEFYKKDSEKINTGDIIFEIEGNARSILKAERFVLNCMQRMSGIATYTTYLNKLINHTDAKILDTRKTTPLNRIIEKWAVRIGGGNNHRYGLYDAIMIKDNHIDFSGNIAKAIKQTKNYLSKNKLNLPIIVEARSLNEVKEILESEKIDRILLDNFDYKTTKKAVKIISKSCETESSGNITDNNIQEYAECGVNYISIGAITNSIKNIDLSLKAYK